MSRFEQARFRARSVSAVAVFVAAALVGKAQAATLTVGPVEQVDLKSSTLVVLGQTYHIGASVSLRNQAGVSVSLDSLAPDSLVSVDGTETAPGAVTVKAITALSQLDVPGATNLLVTGIVTGVSPVGQVRIGNLTVDINATLTSDSQQIAAGELVEVAGTQPTGGGLFLAQSIAPIQGSGYTAAGIKGGGLSLKAAGIKGGGIDTSLGIKGGGLSAAGIKGGGLSLKAAGIKGGG